MINKKLKKGELKDTTISNLPFYMYSTKNNNQLIYAC